MWRPVLRTRSWRCRQYVRRVRISRDGRNEFRNKPVRVQLHQPLALLHVRLPPRQILRLARIHQIHFQTRLFQDLVDRDPIHSRRLHRDRTNPTLLQPFRHRLQLGGGATKASHRLGVAARRYRYVVGCVADINARSLGMHHLQAEVFALHLAHHLPPLLAVHLAPLARRCLATGFLAWLLVLLGFFRCLAFHANLLGLNSTWPGPGGETYTISPSGSGP